MSYDYRSDYWSLISGSTSLYDKISRRTLNFIVDCLNDDSHMISFLAYRAVFGARSASILGRNVVLYSLRYNLSFKRLLKQKRRRYFYDDWAISQLSDKD